MEYSRLHHDLIGSVQNLTLWQKKIIMIGKQVISFNLF